MPMANRMVVDLSDDNDITSVVPDANTAPDVIATPDANAAPDVNAAPPSNTDSPFERSCDNPECSAPKLISLVPKRETAEFITEPLIVNQPILINGFTTVFQVDGIAAKMNDIMNGVQEGESNISKPQSVFRIVPNTHAHIVNYVVVDGAGETMRKIKANEPETMRKLLDSQRLSAEQMLKKLIGKAYKTPKQNAPQVPLPIPSKIPGYTHVQPPTTKATNLPAVLSGVPPGITITPLPLQRKETVNVTSPNTLEPSKLSSTSNASSISTSTDGLIAVSTPSAVDTTARTPTILSSSASTLAPVSPPSTNNMITNIPPSTSVLPPVPNAVQAAPSTEKILTTNTTVENQASRPNILKRKSAFISEMETKKKLRPRSPKHKTPMAAGIRMVPDVTITPTRKLPTLLPKLPTKPTTQQRPLAQSTPLLPKSTNNVDQSEEVGIDKTIPEIDNTVAAEGEESASKNVKVKEPVQLKVRPLIGPASKINAIRASKTVKVTVSMAPTKLDASTKTVASTLSQIVPKKPIIKSANNSDPISNAILQTKPCSVSIVKADLSSTLAAKHQNDPNYESKLVSLRPKRLPTAITSQNTPTARAEGEIVEKDPLLIADSPDLSSIKNDEANMLETDRNANDALLTNSQTQKTNTTLSKADELLSKSETPKDNLVRSVVKSGVMTLPIRSPHPNLKISSVISGGSALAALDPDADVSSSKRFRETSGPDIEKLQKELADLRRTVARLSKKKT